MTASSEVVGPGDWTTYTLIVTNTGAMDLPGVSVEVELPDHFNDFHQSITSDPDNTTCTRRVAGDSSCSPNEYLTWTVGTLASGENRVVTFEPTVANSAPTADALRSLISATAGGSNEATIQRDAIIGNDVSPLPVELALFEATLDGADVLLSWQTASETNNAGFEVQLKRSAEGAFARHGFVEGHGTTTEARQYSYRIADLAPGPYVFRLKQVDLDGASSYSSEVEMQVELAAPYVFSATYPNPFSHRTQFTLAARQAQHVELSVYNVLGQRVALVHEGALEANEAQRFTLGAQGLPNGVYFLRVKGEHFEETRRVVVVK